MENTHRKGFSWIHVLFALVLIIILMGIISPLILIKSKSSARNEALNNAKGIAQGLIDFKNEYGAYPCAFTLEAIINDNRPLAEGVADKDSFRAKDDANAYFAQLLMSGCIDSEAFFYAAGVRGSIKGDDYQGTAAKLLSKGENSFAYIMASDKKPLSDTSSKTPLVMAPLKSIGKDGVPLFHDKIYTGYYVYGTADGSGLQSKISSTGLPLSKGRDHLFQTGDNSLFGKDIPVVKAPLGF